MFFLTYVVPIQYQLNNTNISSDPPTFAIEGDTIYVSEGDPVSVSCPVLGNPQPNITWYKGNDTSPSTVINNNIILHFLETVLDNSGWYTCFAENYLGSVTVTVQLLVGKLYIFVVVVVVVVVLFLSCNYCYLLNLLYFEAIMRLLATAFQSAVC